MKEDSKMQNLLYVPEKPFNYVELKKTLNIIHNNEIKSMTINDINKYMKDNNLDMVSYDDKIHIIISDAVTIRTDYKNYDKYLLEIPCNKNIHIIDNIRILDYQTQSSTMKIDLSMMISGYEYKHSEDMEYLLLLTPYCPFYYMIKFTEKPYLRDEIVIGIRKYILSQDILNKEFKNRNAFTSTHKYIDGYCYEDR